MIERLDHINVRTAHLSAMVEWYEKVLQLRSGPRPPFAFPGAWLYAGQHALVHLVGVDRQPAEAGRDIALEHGAFRATGYGDFIARLDAMGQRREVTRVPEFPIVQVNVWDPDGNHLHVDFDAAEVD